MLRLLVSTFICRGVHNEQCQFLMRAFLQEYRPNMVGVMKRYVGVSGGILPFETKKVLEQAVRSYVALAEMADFVEVSCRLGEYLAGSC